MHPRERKESLSCIQVTWAPGRHSLKTITQIHWEAEEKNGVDLGTLGNCCDSHLPGKRGLWKGSAQGTLLKEYVAIQWNFCHFYFYSSTHENSCISFDTRKLYQQSRSTLLTSQSISQVWNRWQVHGSPLQHSGLEDPWTKEPGGLQSMGLQNRAWLSDSHTHAGAQFSSEGRGAERSPLLQQQRPRQRSDVATGAGRGGWAFTAASWLWWVMSITQANPCSKLFLPLELSIASVAQGYTETWW